MLGVDHRRGLGHRHDRARLGRARRHRRADPEPGHERHLRLVRQLRPRPRRRARRRRQQHHADPRGRPGHPRPGADRRRIVAPGVRGARAGRGRQPELEHVDRGRRPRTTSSSATGRSRSGANFTARDVLVADKVALLGATVARTLFPDQDPVGQIIRVKNLPFRVAGRARAQGPGPVGRRPGRLHRGALHDGAEEAAGHHLPPAGHASPPPRSDAVEPTAVEITRLLRQRHRIAGPRGRRLHRAHGRGDGGRRAWRWRTP